MQHLAFNLDRTLLLIDIGVFMRNGTFCRLLSSFGLPPEPQSPFQDIESLSKHWHPNKDRVDLTVTPFVLGIV